MKNSIVTVILILSMIALAACGQTDSQNAIAEASSIPSEPASSAVPTENAPPEHDDSEMLQETPSEVTEPDSGRTDFEVDFFGENAGNPITVSLELPEGWTRDPSGIYDESGEWIASVELHPVTSGEPFADFDSMYPDADSTMLPTISDKDYPAKPYTLRMEAQGNGDRAAGTQYMYYIMVDDAYVLLFFGPKDTSDVSEDMIQSIVASFEVA